MINSRACLLKLLPMAALLLSCTNMPTAPQSDNTSSPVAETPEPVVPDRIAPEPAVTREAAADKPDATLSPVAEEAPTQPSIKVGTGVFVAPGDAGPADELPAGDVTLNFESAELREFIGVIFGDILKVNYLIDPSVDGVVTLHTTRPISREAVLPVLETVLEQNGAVLVVDQGVYKVISQAAAEGEGLSPVVGRQAQGSAGYSVQIVPLRHVAARDLAAVLKPFVPKGSTVRVDGARNLLVLSGPRYRLNQLLETIEVFDVDWLKGMSYGLFPLQYADASTIVGELQQIIGKEGESPFAGTVRLIAVSRLNAVLVIAYQSRHLSEVRKLIEEFDWGSEATPGRRLYVYNLQHGKAEDIAGVLQDLYSQGGGDTQDEQDSMSTQTGAFRSAAEITRPVSQVVAGEPGGAVETTATPASSADGSVAAESRGPVTIIGDENNNAILVMASPGDYRVIEAAIRKLDTPPRQVLINATIAEVTLTKNLEYGVKWFLDKLGQGSRSGQLGYDAPPPNEAGGSGLTLAILNGAGDARFFFDLLGTESRVKFLSAPQVMVRDNQTASIRVGDQIPVTVRSSQSTLNPDSPLVAEVQFRDTGTLLTVTPSINAGGQVTMEISQEVSLPGTSAVTGGGGNVSIAQRSIDSTVTVQSGQTVVMGGLIREAGTNDKEGVPGLMHLPLVGNLFSRTSKDTNRTELLVTISPTVIEDQNALQAVTRELRDSMQQASMLMERGTLKEPAR